MQKAVRQVTAPIAYVSSVPPEEKAYLMMYGDCEDLPRTNMEREWIETTFEDVRGGEATLSYEKSGFAVRKLSSEMQYHDFEDDTKIWKVYFKELEEHLQTFLGATEVKFFRYGIRKRHPRFPVSTGEEYDFAQPTSIAHVDATLDSTREEMIKQFGDRADGLMAKRFQWVNVWKPLKGPVTDWPLCFCDASSVADSDSEETDMVYPEYFTENLSLRFNGSQKWYYLSDHLPEEIIIFKQSDSDLSGIGGVPHCSFANPMANPESSPRESIEARALVIF